MSPDATSSLVALAGTVALSIRNRLPVGLVAVIPALAVIPLIWGR